MKKKIIIALCIVIIVLAGMYAYLSYSGPKYTIETETNKNNESNKTDENSEENGELAHSHINDELEREIDNENEPIKLNDVVNEETLNELIPELEDLSGTKYSYTYKENEASQIQKDSVALKGDNLSIKVFPTDNSRAFANIEYLNNEEKESTRVCMVLSNKANTVAFVNPSGLKYTNDEVKYIYSKYKELDQQDMPTSSYYRYYDFGEIKPFEYKGYTGTYNETISGHTVSGVDYNFPFVKRHIIALNIKGELVSITIETYLNTSFGQMSTEELLDYMLTIEEA